MAKLVDAQDLKSCGHLSVWVRLPPGLPIFGPMVKLVDTLDSRSSAVRRGGSTPSRATKSKGKQNEKIIYRILDFDLFSLVQRDSICWSEE